MAVYVGVPMWPFGRMVMCHMFASTNDELEKMARQLRLKPSWVQKPRESIGPHYDISKSKRLEAIALGAIACDTIEEEVDAFEIVEQERLMSKDKNKTKRTTKKIPQKTLKEKRAEKRGKEK